MLQLLRRLFLFLSLAATLGLIPRKAMATHLAGSDITYTCLGGNTYRIDLTFYRDCAGTPAPGGVILNFRSISCNSFFTQEIDSVNNTGQQITYPCPGLATRCDNASSTIPGIRQYHYSGIITFPLQCSDWVIQWNYCCRNCDITTINIPQPCVPQQNPGMSISANLDNLNITCNNSPRFTNIPIVFICVGQNFTYNHGAVDPDGDSLVYSLVDPLADANNPVPWLPGYSATNPISSSPAVTLNSQTGDIVMNPTAQEVGVMSVLVQEYRNGVLIGHVVRDMEIYVRACNNILPTASGINGTTSRDTTVCPGTVLCFDVFSNDTDTGQIVTMTWNNAIPFATFTTSGFPHPTGNFCWTPDVTDISTTPHQFTVSVVDNACPNSGYQTYSFNILVNSPLLNINVTDITCNGLSNGAINVVPVNPGGYSYSWSPGNQTTSGITNLGPGSYTVTVYDSTTGCSGAFPKTLLNPPALSDSTYVITSSCTGSNTGVAAVVASGGTPPYSYSWNTTPPSSNDTISGVPSGTYIVTITDFRGCTKTDSVNVNFSSSALNITVDSVSSLACYTDTSGIASVSVTGGSPGYTYSWNTNPVQSGPTAIGLSPGSYIVTVTDSLGCSSTKTATVTSPPQIIMTGSATNASCNASDGVAFVSVTGGLPPYTYAWQGFPNTTDSLPNVPPGFYYATATDSNSCTMTLGVLVGSQVITSSASTITPVGCKGDSNAVAIASASGGTAPYSYLWNTVPPQNTDTATGLHAGIFIVTITDATTCFTVDTVHIQDPPVMSVTISSVNASCSGTGVGSATANPVGGVAAYTYLWSPSGGTNQTATNLIPGNYDVTVTDTYGCIKTASTTITQDTIIVITVDSTNRPICNGGFDGSIYISVTGGTGSYAYVWNSGVAFTQDLINIAAGFYTVVVTDQGGCTETTSVQLSNPPPVPAYAGSDTAICAGTSILLNADAPPSGLTGIWTGPAGVTFSNANDPKAMAFNMPPGFATLTWTVTDGIGCTGTDNVSVFGFNTSAGSDIARCDRGPVQLMATIIAGLTGMWTGSSNVNFNDPSLTNAVVTANDYGIENLIWTVSGAACSNTDTVEVAFYQPPTAEAGDSQTVCVDKAMLHALVVAPGTGAWSERNPSQAVIADTLNPTSEVTTLLPGITVFLWTMTNGVCSASDTVFVKYDIDCELQLPSAFSPNGDLYNDGYLIKGIEAYPKNIFRVFNRWGNEVYVKQNYVNTEWMGQNKNGDDLPEGTYFVILQITDKDITKNTYVDLRRYSGKK